MNELGKTKPLTTDYLGQAGGDDSCPSQYPSLPTFRVLPDDPGAL